MRILVYGSSENFAEFALRFVSVHDCRHAVSQGSLTETYPYDAVFDFRIERTAADLEHLAVHPLIFINTAATTLASTMSDTRSRGNHTWFGFNGLKSFMSTQNLEVCLNDPTDESLLKKMCERLPIGYTLVRDQVGMVTPRIISMIINEAYLTVEEGTAAREDIDLAMKLGTNYPYGPFEWCHRIGASDIVRVLNALYRETGSSQYKVASLLASEAAVRIYN